LGLPVQQGLHPVRWDDDLVAVRTMHVDDFWIWHGYTLNSSIRMPLCFIHNTRMRLHAHVH